MMMQKGALYIKLFITLSRVRKLSWILSQLNILCTTLVKPYKIKKVILQSFTIDTLWQLCVPNVLNLEEAVKHSVLYQEYIIVLNFAALRYSLR